MAYPCAACPGQGGWEPLRTPASKPGLVPGETGKCRQTESSGAGHRSEHKSYPSELPETMWEQCPGGVMGTTGSPNPERTCLTGRKGTLVEEMAGIWMGHKSNGISASRLVGKLCQGGGVNMAGGARWGGMVGSSWSREQLPDGACHPHPTPTGCDHSQRLSRQGEGRLLHIDSRGRRWWPQGGLYCGEWVLSDSPTPTQCSSASDLWPEPGQSQDHMAGRLG